ncbi:HlyIII-domain-containing protein [Rhizoclosmatium globosum]|uniref:HlyIII-domain-containing protein n=1 Tax=Rhizoclosmatium globosum TaxID=329046 RepID=A0A1Y2CPL5_9FUNG|nr:HlyIII-domain-containing protein [Rhizoclosmatium globosum]|eukprot:ORY48943.1 HlyIII-domain-containing protein [Rhizoclosmatium globosum]
MKSGKPALLTKDQMPPWYQIDSFINTGYRPIMPSFKKCVESLFYIHNETGSIYTHAIGVPIVLALAVHSFGPVMHHLELTGVGWEDIVIFSMYHIFHLICYWNSAVFHTFCCHSQTVNHNCLMADLLGICASLSANFLAYMYYGFYCEESTKFVYMSCFTALACATVAVNTFKRFMDPKYSILRMGLFLAFGYSGLIPMVHILWKHGLEYTQRSLGLNYMLLMAITNTTGAVCFGFKIPERYFPITFDFWGNSHQIMHVMVLAGNVFLYFGLAESFRFWHTLNGTCSVDIGSMNVTSYDPWFI